jgi:hypothetical protein
MCCVLSRRLQTMAPNQGIGPCPKACVQLSAYMHIKTCTYMHITDPCITTVLGACVGQGFSPMLGKHSCMHTCMYTFTHTHTHMLDAYTQIHTCTHIFTHTCSVITYTKRDRGMEEGGQTACYVETPLRSRKAYIYIYMYVYIYIYIYIYPFLCHDSFVDRCPATQDTSLHK